MLRAYAHVDDTNHKSMIGRTCFNTNFLSQISAFYTNAAFEKHWDAIHIKSANDFRPKISIKYA